MCVYSSMCILCPLWCCISHCSYIRISIIKGMCTRIHGIVYTPYYLLWIHIWTHKHTQRHASLHLYCLYKVQTECAPLYEPHAHNLYTHARTCIYSFIHISIECIVFFRCCCSISSFPNTFVRSFSCSSTAERLSWIVFY